MVNRFHSEFNPIKRDANIKCATIRNIPEWVVFFVLIRMRMLVIIIVIYKWNRMVLAVI